MSENHIPEVNPKSPFRDPAEMPTTDEVWGNKRVSFGSVFLTTLGVGLAIGVVGGVLTLIGYPIYKAISADGRRDYCYVEPDTYAVKGTTATGEAYDCRHYVDGYTLKEHVPWRSDRILASDLKSTDDVRAEAEKYNCELK